MTTGQSPDGPDDAELLAHAQRGDERALNLLVRRHQGGVYRFLLNFLRDEDQAADAAQNTFLRAIRRLDGFRGDSSFRTWLFSIARNEALSLSRTRRRRREERLVEDDLVSRPADAPDEVAIRSDEVRRVREALARLPEKQRLSVSLRLFDQLSFREIGGLTNSTEGAARVNYHYGIGRLREWLGEHAKR